MKPISIAELRKAVQEAHDELSQLPEDFWHDQKKRHHVLGQLIAFVGLIRLLHGRQAFQEGIPNLLADIKNEIYKPSKVGINLLSMRPDTEEGIRDGICRFYDTFRED